MAKHQLQNSLLARKRSRMKMRSHCLMRKAQLLCNYELEAGAEAPKIKKKMRKKKRRVTSNPFELVDDPAMAQHELEG